MSTVSYYPGCSLHATARDYQESIDGITRLMGIDLREIDDWNCCGASAAHALNHDLSLGLAARNLHRAEKSGMDVVVPCALCYHQLKQGEKALLTGWDKTPEYAFEGKIKIFDLLAYLAQPEVLIPFEAKVVKPLKNLKAVCYYGCQVVRPPEVTGHPNPENPMDMDNIVKACGGTPLDWSHKTDCCGASLAMPKADILHKLVGDLYDRALETGANAIIVSCQMCQANLDMYQTEIAKSRGVDYNIPIIYFTELMGAAAGLTEISTWFGRHFVDPTAVIKEAS
jgi:heterodisulfide reductase subunit B